MNDTLPSKKRTVSKELILEIGEAFNSRNVERIMSYFTDDCTFLMASGPEPDGRVISGKAAVRKVLADRFKIIPDMKWNHLYEYVCGDRAVSVWNYRGCDLWDFKDGLVCNKDTYWKMVRPD